VRHRVFGYHGTTDRAADGILSDPTQFALSTSAGDWLGIGVYFFESSYQKGLEWARRTVEKDRLAGFQVTEAVLGCEIDLSHCLDFCDPSQTAAFGRWADAHIDHTTVEVQHAPRLYTPRGREFSISDRAYRLARYRGIYKYPHKVNVFDKTLIEAYVAGLRPAKRFTTVRAPFNSGRQMFPNSYLFHNSQIQIAVRDPARAVRNLQIVDGPMGRRSRPK
jgi:hypothetical protein